MNLRHPTTHTKLSPFQDHPRHPKGTASKSSVGLNIHIVIVLFYSLSRSHRFNTEILSRTILSQNLTKRKSNQ